MDDREALPCRNTNCGRVLLAMADVSAFDWKFRLRTHALRRIPMLRLGMLYRGHLRASGWRVSARAGAPLTADGNPIAWYTYPALAFLEPRLRSDMEVFEYGAGNSTLWWAARVAHVSSVESDREWVGRLRLDLPPNVDVRHVPEPEAYALSAQHRGRRFDIVVIDGINRNRCANACLNVLSDSGVVIWDNAERERLYGEGLELLRSHGFRRIEFDGLGPMNGYAWRTSIFYRPETNCLGI